MKCQHCGSTDVVAIQGQNFCINCGQQLNDQPKKSDSVPAPGVKPEEEASEEKTIRVETTPVAPSVAIKKSPSEVSKVIEVPQITKAAVKVEPKKSKDAKKASKNDPIAQTVPLL